MLKKKKTFLLITLGTAVLLIGGGVAAYWLLVQRNLSLANAPAQLVPQDALLTASISTDAAQWQQLQQYGTPETKAAFNEQLTKLRDEVLTANGYTYERDIQPWLGKTVMIAYLTGASVPGTAPGQIKPTGIPFLKQPDLIVLPIDNPTQARQLLDKVKSQKTTPWIERTYKGVQIRETQKSNSQNYSATVLGRFLVVTNNPKTTDRVIDTYKGAASVATTPGYAEELQKINALNPFAQLYLNVPVLSSVLAANSTRSLSPDKIAAAEQRQGVAATVTLEPEGIGFQGISWLKPNSTQKNDTDNTSTRLPRRLPAETLLMLSGGNLAQLWQSYAQGADQNPILPIPPINVIGGFKGILDLDLEADLLPWMAGEFTLALVPASPEALTSPENRQSPQLGAGVALMVQASDRTRAEATLQKLDELMATRYQFQVSKTKQGGQPVVKWTSPLGGLSATHGWLEGNVVFLTLGAPIAGSIVPQPPATLTQTPLFQQTVPTKPNPNNGQFFLDVERTINSSALNLPQLLPSEYKMVANAIRAIGVTVANSDRRTTRFDLFVQLKQAITPGNSPGSTPSLSSPNSPSAPQTPLGSPALPQKPQTSQTPSSSPSVPQIPLGSPALPEKPLTSQTPLDSPSVPQPPQPSPTPSP
ncbi:MAG: DUF3352 domain-containing protein [Coleofasciculus sp. Co-bin14]|nr:DUF3352 domain-containing protein [Coleofasciculus sp. Co-bin14]